jgi:hypothetical protein
VIDTTSPKVTAPADVTVEASSLTNNVVSTGTATAKDIMGIASITNNAPDTFPFGETIVTWTATDPSVNSATTTQKITVIDTTGPKLVIPDNVVIDATSLETTVSIGKATATDIIDSNPTIANNAPFTFQLGETIVTWTATDTTGNSAVATQKITVVDTTTPTIVAPEYIETEATSATENKVTLGQATAADFVGIQSITNDGPNTFPVGETIVTWTATDTTDHTATATQKVIIKDTTSPILKVPDSITVEATNESANSVNIGEAKASDLVGIQSITNDAPDVFPLGLTGQCAA